MFCASCGTKLNENAKFCGSCGSQVISNPENNKEILSEIQQLEQTIISPEIKKQETPEVLPQNKHIKHRKPLNKRALKFKLLSILCCVVLALLLPMFLFFEKAIIIQSVKSITTNNFLFGDFSFHHIINSLISGNERYFPTVLSIVMGVTAVIFVFAASFFWLLSVFTAIIRKGQNGMRRISIILTVFALGSVCTLPQLAYNFVPPFKLIYARAGGVLLEDLRNVMSPLSYVWGSIILLLIIMNSIFNSKQNSKKGVLSENEG